MFTNGATAVSRYLLVLQHAGPDSGGGFATRTRESDIYQLILLFNYKIATVSMSVYTGTYILLIRSYMYIKYNNMDIMRKNKLIKFKS